MDIPVINVAKAVNVLHWSDGVHALVPNVTYIQLRAARPEALESPSSLRKS